MQGIQGRGGDGENLAEVSALSVVGFQALGPKAETALPELNGLLRTSTQLSPRVVAILRAIGTNAIPILQLGLTNANPHARAMALWHLDSIGNPTLPSTQQLLDALRDPHGKVRSTAAFLIGEHAKEPAEIIPPLLVTLNDVDPDVRANSALALKGFPRNLRELDPVLFETMLAAVLNAAADLDPAVRSAASATARYFGVPLPYSYEERGL